MTRQEDDFHDKLVSPLEMIDKSFLNIKKINPVLKINCIGENCKHTIIYKPDFCFAHKPTKTSEEIIIFEIVKKQGQAKTIADILRMKFLRNCRKGFFICDNKKKERMVVDALCVTLSRLEELTGVEGKRNVVDIDPIQISPKAEDRDIFQSLVLDIHKVIKLKSKDGIEFLFDTKNGIIKFPKNHNLD